MGLRERQVFSVFLVTRFLVIQREKVFAWIHECNNVVKRGCLTRSKADSYWNWFDYIVFLLQWSFYTIITEFTWTVWYVISERRIRASEKQSFDYNVPRLDAVERTRDSICWSQIETATLRKPQRQVYITSNRPASTAPFKIVPMHPILYFVHLVLHVSHFPLRDSVR